MRLDFQAKVCTIISSGKSPRLSPKFHHLQDSRGLEPFHLDNYELGLLSLEVQGHRISKVDQQIAKVHGRFIAYDCRFRSKKSDFAVYCQEFQSRGRVLREN